MGEKHYLPMCYFCSQDNSRTNSMFCSNSCAMSFAEQSVQIKSPYWCKDCACFFYAQSECPWCKKRGLAMPRKG
jgi:hypothetical protein